MAATAGQRANWAKAKVSGSSFKEHSVPVNTKSIKAPLGLKAMSDKHPPRLSGRKK